MSNGLIRLGDSVQGDGVDLARIRSNGDTAFVEVLRGDTLRRVWRAPVPAPGTFVAATAHAADLDGDGFGEVLVTIVTRGAATGSLVQHGYILNGRDGSI